MKYFTLKNLAILLLLVSAGFAIFLNLDAQQIVLWDEGTYAVNAYEMYLNGNYLVKYYDGIPEMFATNPPFVCYLQVICMKIFGPGELAVRLPSGLAAMGVVLLIIRYARKENLGLDFAFYAVLFLVTAKGYIGYHVVRNGDLDSVLIFFVTGSIIYFDKFIEYEDKKIKYLLVFSTFVLFGFFTKGIACLLVAPAFIIYATIRNKLKYIFKTKQVYYCFFSVLLLIVLYYGFRELKTPGYISFMLQSEIGRWYTQDAIHDHPFNFYLTWLSDKHFTYFLYLVPIAAFVLLLLPKDNEFRKKSTIWLISMLTFFLIISFSKTKLEWYDAPLIPMMSIFLALALKAMLPSDRLSTGRGIAVKVLFVCCMFAAPYYSQIQQNLIKHEGWHDVNFGMALRQYNKLHNVPKKMELLYTTYNGHAIFYKMLYNDKYGYEITSRDVAGNITMKPGQVYLFTHPAIKDYLEKNFTFKVYFEGNSMMVVETLNYRATTN